MIKTKKTMKPKETPDLFNNFLKILRALASEKVEYVLIGGFAVILHGLARLTSDIDLFIKPEAENLGRLKKALTAVFPADMEIDAISLQDLSDYAVIRFGTEADFYIDIVARIGEMFRYEDLQFEIRDVEGVPVRIATPETLFKMKKDTVRPEDKRDAWFLSELIASRVSK
jgi:predicted nucleotidyltransferase